MSRLGELNKNISIENSKELIIGLKVTYYIWWYPYGERKKQDYSEFKYFLKFKLTSLEHTHNLCRKKIEYLIYIIMYSKQIIIMH